ncbi:MAG: sensor histidine kinase [Lachnospiraceae bacterium]|nr:sensor histidine kinase [Lachnospiraceae bacterium]
MKNMIKRSFKQELLAGILFVAVLPLVVSCLFLIQLFKAKAANDYRKKDLEQAAVIEERLSELFSLLDETAGKLAEDEAIRQALISESYGRRSEIYSLLYGVTGPLRSFAQFDLYSADGLCLYSTGTGMFHKTLPPYWGILKAASARPGKLSLQKTQEENTELLTAARVILSAGGEAAGFVVVSLGEENFEEVLKGVCGSQDGICILDGFFETVYSAGTARREGIGSVLRERRLLGKPLTEACRGNSVYVSALSGTGLYSVLLRPEVFTEDTVRSMYTVLFIMTGVSFLLCLAVSAKMSSHLSRPIRILNTAMQAVQEGHLDTRVQTERIDEFGQLADNFDTMTARLSEYMDEQVAQQKRLNEVQIAMMQSQLNPHFLYNTLDTMKWVAKANHIPEIATLAAKLAKILRTSISGEPFLALSEELELVECYAEIQRLRFGGKFAFTCVLPEELSDCMVPKLIVQPIVENAVLHGLAESDEGHIVVRVSESADENLLLIEVTDDGCGIEETVMEHLNSRDRRNLKGHIGFYNVDMIIRLHYGDGYGLKVGRRPEGGTRVLLTLPKQREAPPGQSGKEERYE